MSPQVRIFLEANILGLIVLLGLPYITTEVDSMAPALGAFFGYFITRWVRYKG